MFQATLERLQKSLEAGFKSPHLPARMGCLHSVLYLLQCDGNLERDVVTSLLPMTTDYLQLYLRHTSTSDLCHSEDHVTLMWAVAFYVIEYHHQHIEQVGLRLPLSVLWSSCCLCRGQCNKFMTYLRFRRDIHFHNFGVYSGGLSVLGGLWVSNIVTSCVFSFFWA